jgi:hypothetical protein
LVYFAANRYLCIFCSQSVYFSRFGMLYQEKSGNPGLSTRKIFFKVKI